MIKVYEIHLLNDDMFTFDSRQLIRETTKLMEFYCDKRRESTILFPKTAIAYCRTLTFDSTK